MDSATARMHILIVDDHALFRESVARLLNAEPISKSSQIAQPQARR